MHLLGKVVPVDSKAKQEHRSCLQMKDNQPEKLPWRHGLKLCEMHDAVEKKCCVCQCRIFILSVEIV